MPAHLPVTDSEPSREPINFLVYSAYPRYSGGRETWLFNVGGELARRGRPVTVMALASSRPAFHTPTAGVEIVSLRTIRHSDRAFMWFNRILLGLPALIDAVLIYPLRAGAILRRRQPRSLLCMNSIPEGLAALIAGTPFLVSVRGDVPAEMSHGVSVLERFLRWIERGVLRRARHVLSNGPDTRDRMRREGIDSDVVPNGVDLERFRKPAPDGPEAMAVTAAAQGRPIVAVVGTLRPVKGTELAMEVAAELKRAGVRCMMAMVGKGDLKRYRALAERLGVSDMVWFGGETQDVPGVLSRADVFLGLSGGSGLSMAALEAMAAAVPVVAVDTPVYRQLITDGKNGLLAGSPRDLASACARLLGDPEGRQRIGRAGSEVADQYGWPAVVDRLEAALADGAPAARVAPATAEPPSRLVELAMRSPGVLLPLLLLTIPLEFTKRYFPSQLFEVGRLVMIVLILVLVVTALAQHSIHMPAIGLWLPPAVLISYAAISAISVASTNGLRTVAAALTYGLVALGIYNWTRSRLWQEKLWSWFGVSCIGLAIITLGQRATGRYIWNPPSTGNLERFNATFADPNVLGRVLIIMIVCGVVIAPIMTSRGSRITLVVATLLSSAAVPLTYSRQAFVIGAVLLIAGIVLAQDRRRSLMLAAAALAAFGAVTLFVPDVQSRLGLLQQNLTGAPSHLFEGTWLAFLNYLPLDSERHYLIAAGLQMMADHPVFGVGFGNFPMAIQGAYSSFILKGYTTTESHTSLVTVLAELGVVGFLVMVWWLVAYARRSVATFRSGGPFAPFVVASALSAGVIFLDSQLNARLVDEPYLWVFLGLGWAAISMGVSDRAVSQPAETTTSAATNQNSTARSFFQ